MVASSEQQSAPVIVINPATAQASSSQPGAPINRADSAEVIKTPEPIIDPITIMVASSEPSARTSPACCRSSILFFIQDDALCSAGRPVRNPNQFATNSENSPAFLTLGLR